jgi:ribosomal protein L29
MHSLVQWLSDNFGKLAVLTLATSFGSLVFSVVHVLKTLRQLKQKSVREASAHSEELKHALTNERDQSGTDGWDKQNVPDAPRKHKDVLAPVGQGASSTSGQSQLGSVGCN